MTNEEMIKNFYKPLMAKIMSIEKQLDTFAVMLNTQRASDIDFIAMETGVELEQEDEE